MPGESDDGGINLIMGIVDKLESDMKWDQSKLCIHVDEYGLNRAGDHYFVSGYRSKTEEESCDQDFSLEDD